MSFAVVIPSGRASNLVECVRSILTNEPDLSPSDIIVVEDGSRREAEAYLPAVHWLEGVKPFVFARSANQGIRVAGKDALLLNDDTRLVTPRGFSLLAEQVRAQPNLAVCSVGIRGVVANPRQIATTSGQLRLETRFLAFIGVYVPWSVFDLVGPLDERFTGYGYEDNDYCVRVLAAGLDLGIWDGCVVEHGVSLPPIWRLRPDINEIMRQNQLLFRHKWNQEQVRADRRVGMLYLAHNRLELTRCTFMTLIANTDWQHVRELLLIPPLVSKPGNQRGEWTP